MLTFIFAALMSNAKADTGTVAWPSRNSKVICGATVDGEALDFHVVVANELIGSQSKDERVLVYVDLHKPGQVRFVLNEAISDSEYEAREAAMAKLAPEEADLMRALTVSRQTELYAGIAEGYVHLSTIMKKRTLSLSCQEIMNANALSNPVAATN
ncbi:MAG: hypothetical protein ACXVA9_00465 [Bdellovibrionales bacterium]